MKQNSILSAKPKQQTARGRITAKRYRALMKKLSYVRAGRKFTREEMNER